ncbi:oligogalacturonate-specific porin KdgM family protein [Vibrio splendidus]|uniref:oligogalacturonate-specific porin KdgM family protein n=1 Tax=Vibrio splendidus TaxID=29497 RepID=UPI0022366E7C|nr:oligogalacturonate-specific porin KdgM family protein [Vibrio splendidus]MCW4445256.1 oligogalacturonate-specific porin KdgM family protein [Vibrio splendidus]
MNSVTKIAAAVACTLLAGTAAGASLDYRYEYRAATDYTKTNGDTAHVDARHQHRVKLGESFKLSDKWKHSTGLELKFHGDDSDYDEDSGSVKSANSQSFYDGNWYIYGMEIDNTATYKIDNNWYLQMGMPIAWDWDEPNANDGDWKMKKVTFKPQFRVGYKADMGLTTAIRYRHEYADFRNHTQFGDKDSETGERLESAQKSKVTLTGSYKIESLPKLGLSYEANYVKSLDNVLLYNSDDWEWDAGLKVNYKFGSWKPFAEIWSSDISSSSKDREAKYRVGIAYSF